MGNYHNELVMLESLFYMHCLERSKDMNKEVSINRLMGKSQGKPKYVDLIDMPL